MSSLGPMLVFVRGGAIAAANGVAETSASQIIKATIDSVNLVDEDLPLLLLWRRS
jgi:hypothetical protein